MSDLEKIPKIIHYCWFGHNPLPPLAVKCIESWRKFLPDYEIKEWNEDNFDVNIITYTAEAYKAEKYAFVSDYARFWILYKFGGIYFDTDVEVIRPMDDIIERGPFMGCDTDAKPGAATIGVAPGLGLSANPGLDLYKKILDMYSKEIFVWERMGKIKTVVQLTTELLFKEGLKNEPGIQEVGGVWIYPSEYFNPMNVITKHLHITENTRSIHKYAATWVEPSRLIKLKYAVRKYLPEWLLIWYNRRPWKKR